MLTPRSNHCVSYQGRPYKIWNQKMCDTSHEESESLEGGNDIITRENVIICKGC